MSWPTLLNRRHALTVLGGSLAAPLIIPGLASAQDAWPSRTVRYVNGFPAGGATDTLSRILCQKMTEISGQPFVVENKSGAGGVVGADTIAKSAPDGYTIGLGGIANNVLAIGSYAKLPYRAVEDFTFISGIWRLPNLLAARKDIPTTDLKELIALCKKEPGKWTFASGGIGTTPHLSGEMFNSMAGVQITHVPYKGGAPAMTDLLAGRVDLLFDNLPGALPNVRAGLIKPVAVTAPTRVPELPDVPAMAEILPGYQLTSWIALIGPAGMAADLVGKINALCVKALADPGLKARYNDLGATPMPMTPAEVKAFRDSEEARLLPIMKAAGIKPE
jgi:tripartite-type tricarboxylate transporter receptor subunit TctC